MSTAPQHADERRGNEGHAGEFMPRLLFTAGALGLAAVMSFIPAPGLNAEALPPVTGRQQLGSLLHFAFSIIALRLTPLVTALALIETFRLLLPGMSRWNTADLEYRTVHTRVLLGFAFALALFQGWGVATSLEDIGTPTAIVPEPGNEYRWTYMLTQVAGVALLAVLANAITVFGVGSGYWVLLAAFDLIGLPNCLLAAYEDARGGLIAAENFIGLAAVGVAGAVALAHLFHKGLTGGRTARQSAADLILPLFLGCALGGFVYGFWYVTAQFLAMDPSLDGSAPTTAPGRLIIEAQLVALFAWVRAADDRTRAWQIAAVSCALLIGLRLAAESVGLDRVLRPDVLAITVVVLTLAWHQSGPSRATATTSET